MSQRDGLQMTEARTFLMLVWEKKQGWGVSVLLGRAAGDEKRRSTLLGRAALE